jgi:hypothetical protein
VQAPDAWLGAAGVPLLYYRPDKQITSLQFPAEVLLSSTKEIRRLAALDRINPAEHALRIGWAWVAGPVERGERSVRSVFPLLSVPVRLERSLTGFTAIAAGDPRLTALVEDPGAAERLELDAQFGGGAISAVATDLLVERLPHLQRWVRDVLHAADIRQPVRLVSPNDNPLDHADGAELVVVAGTGLFYAGDVVPLTVGATLHQWAGVPSIDRSAFAALYFPEPGALAEPDSPVQSPLPLTEAQDDVIRRSRCEPVVAVSGAPGNGKSHAAVAAALDAVARGERVLVATRSISAADVLADILQRQPGPVPVVFGSTDRRAAIARQLSEGTPHQVPHREAHQAYLSAAERAADVRRAVALALDAEAAATGEPGHGLALDVLRVEVPGAFEADADLDGLERLIAGARQPSTGWLARRRIQRAERALRASLDPAARLQIGDLAAAVHAARRQRLAAVLESRGGTVLDGLWPALVDAEADARTALGRAVEARADAARTRGGDVRRSIVALARALRAGRAARREMLAELDGSALLEALPLWVGTLADIDDLLPPVAGLFDLLVLDEASHIDQVQAAAALLRAKRVLVAGDPHQLRHVSFASDEDVSGALARHGIEFVADRLDVRRMSTFDVAAAAAPVTWLDEHHRSVPHLIEFSAERFYPRPVLLARRHPSNECLDAIDVTPAVGARDDHAVNQAELKAVADVLRGLHADEPPTVGVVTPFRAQADAIEAMVLDCFALEDIEALDLRVATVHGFQGDERDVVLLSPALGPADLPGGRSFVEDPNLFNVFVTRARERMVVVTSLDAGAGGLLGDFLAYADRAPAPPPTGEPEGWAAALAAELARAGWTVRADYPVGRWTVDLCVSNGACAAGLFCFVHPDGAATHIRRQLDLLSVGWALVDAFPTRWGGDAVRAALDLDPRVTDAVASATGTSDAARSDLDG